MTDDDDTVEAIISELTDWKREIISELISARAAIWELIDNCHEDDRRNMRLTCAQGTCERHHDAQRATSNCLRLLGCDLLMVDEIIRSEQTA